jgi:Na+-translocating ferredoxin:NAD+ oxidoreductase RnfA subunit
MIQRIQSLFLFIVFIAGIYLFFLPVAFYSSDILLCKFNITGISQINGQPQNFPNTIPIIIFTIIMIVLPFVIIFLYKKQPLQMKLCRLGIIINVLLIAVIFWYADIIEKKLCVDSIYKIGVFLPLLTLIFLFLANMFIRKDEKLIKSADRLR